MAYWIQEIGSNKNASNYHEYMCDYLIDISKLPTQKKHGAVQDNDTVSDSPTAAGSECFCIEDGSQWVLSKDADIWINIPVSGIGGQVSSEDIQKAVERYMQTHPIETTVQNYVNKTITSVPHDEIDSIFETTKGE